MSNWQASQTIDRHHGPDIRYEVKHWHKRKSEWMKLESLDKPIILETKDQDIQRETEKSEKIVSIDVDPVLTITTQVYGYDRRKSRKASDKARASDIRVNRRSNDTDSSSEDESLVNREGSKEPLNLEHFHVTSTETEMTIESPLLQDAFSQIMDYYHPSQDGLGMLTTVDEPYEVLLLHERELRDFHDYLVSKMKSEVAGEPKGPDSEQARHVRVLLDFIKPYAERTLPHIQHRLKQDVPTVTWDSIWYLLRPGTISYCLFDNERIGCVILRAKRKIKRDAKRWNVHVWFLDFQDKLRRGFTLSRKSGQPRTKHYINFFEGERTVTSLPVFPRQYWDCRDQGKRKTLFEERGKKKLDLLRNEPKQMTYEGQSLENKRRNFRGRGVLDSTNRLHITTEFPDTRWTFDSRKEPADIEWMKPKDETDPHRPRSKLADYLDMDDSRPESIRKEQYFLMSPQIGFFSLENKKWLTGHVDCLGDLEPNIQNNPIVQDDNLEIIKAISHSQTSPKAMWSADFIKGKGEGVVILIHGPPGVGKTFSVESISLSTGRPLLSLTMADIEAKEDEIETQLSSWLYLAERWKALLLIDEADIFLERRKHADIARNGIVSAFLRKMEYFRGILFLTTNRVGQLDEAFVSRAHIVLHYPELTDEQRHQIWNAFFEKLRKERGKEIMIGSNAKKYVLKSSTDLGMELNGREIRNTLQTAIALAEYETRKNSDPKSDGGDIVIVEEAHFKRVLGMTRSFGQYLQSMRGEELKDRAKHLENRNDYFRPDER